MVLAELGYLALLVGGVSVARPFGISDKLPSSVILLLTLPCSSAVGLPVGGLLLLGQIPDEAHSLKLGKIGAGSDLQ